MYVATLTLKFKKEITIDAKTQDEAFALAKSIFKKSKRCEVLEGFEVSGGGLKVKSAKKNEDDTPVVGLEEVERYCKNLKF